MANSPSPTYLSGNSLWNAYSFPDPNETPLLTNETPDCNEDALNDDAYNAFWQALQPIPVRRFCSASGRWEDPVQTLPDLKGKEQISTWLKNPENHEALKDTESLYFSHCPTFLPPEAIPLLYNLKRIDFYRCNFINKHLELSNLPSLNNIIISECNSLDTLRLDNLQELHHFGCYDTPLCELEVQNLPSLTFLTCKNSNLKEIHFRDLSHLERLDFSESKDLSRFCLDNLPCLTKLSSHSCPALETLELCNLPSLQEMRYRKPQRYSQTAFLPVRYLDAWGRPDQDAFCYYGSPFPSNASQEPDPIELDCSELSNLKKLKLHSLPHLEKFRSQKIQNPGSHTDQSFSLKDLPKLKEIEWLSWYTVNSKMIDYSFENLPMLDERYWPKFIKTEHDHDL